MTARRNLWRAGAFGLIGLLAVAAGAGAAWAQIETNSRAPIDITANEAEVVNAKCLAIWRGAAEALQGDTRLRADTITVRQAVKAGGGGATPNCGATQAVIADGNVYYVTPTQNARGDHAVYDAASDEIVITGDVIIVQGKNVARGDRLVIKVATKQFTMTSKATGAAAHNRVRGVFYPERKAEASTAPAAAPAAQP